MPGTQLETNGWRQGAVAPESATPQLLNVVGIGPEPGIILVVASQSCDIACNNLELDPHIEFLIARSIDSLNGNFTFNKNPRLLNLSLFARANDESISTEKYFEIKAFEKVFIPKQTLLDICPEPCSQLTMDENQRLAFVGWLSARYSRPALPTVFNNLISDADPRGKLREKAKKGSAELLGIYVEIFPDREIGPGEKYQANLLGLIPAGLTGDQKKAEAAINLHSEILKKAGIDVSSAIRAEDGISVATIKRFRRFYYDDLSFKDGADLPPETLTNL